MSAALFAFLASFDELIISLFLAGVRSQTLPVRIWNSLHLQVEPIIAAVSAFLIGVTALILCSTASCAIRSRSAAGARRLDTSEAQLPATGSWRGARLIGSQPVSVTIAVSPSDMLSPVSLLSRIMCRKNTMLGAKTCGLDAPRPASFICRWWR